MPDNTDPKSDTVAHDTKTTTSGWTGGWWPVPYSNQVNHRWFKRDRWWHRQTKPFIATMRYETRTTRVWPQSFRTTTYHDRVGGFIYAESEGVASVDYRGAESYALGLPYVKTLADVQNATLDLAKGQSWNMPVFAAELGKTRDFVVDFVNSVSNGYSSFRQFKRSPKRAFATMKRAFSRVNWEKHAWDGSQSLATLWLQYRYAIMTGIQDIKDAAKTVADIASAHKMAERVIRANRTAVVSSTHKWRSGSFGFIGMSAIDTDGNHSGQITCSAWIRVKPNFTNSITWEASQLGLLNPVAALYELTFLSFVADWIIDLGSYLERLNALAGLTVVDAGTSVTRRGVIEYIARTTRDGYVYLHPEMSPVIAESTIYNRSRWENPAPVWTPGVNMSTNRWIDAAALLRVIALGKVK